MLSGSITRPCPFPVTGNGHGRVPSPRESMIKVHDGQKNGPIRTEMTLLTTNEIAELADFWAWPLKGWGRDSFSKLQIVRMDFDHVTPGRGNLTVSAPRYGEQIQTGYQAQKWLIQRPKFGDDLLLSGKIWKILTTRSMLNHSYPLKWSLYNE